MTTAAPDNKLRELEEENELLISQLHLVQEELERYYLKNKELEASASNGHKQASSGSTTVQLKAWVDDELPAALAENARLKTLLEMQQQVRQLETESSLPARMYAALAEVAGTSGKFVRVPKQLLSFWRKENTKAIPSILGGKGHPKVVTAYQNKGMQGAAELLKNNSLSVTQVANAWTDLARHLQETDPKECAKAARHAYEADPKPFRLKWLAFRLNRADKPQEAEAALDLLPANMLLSESEQSSADKIRTKARKEREQQAKKGCQFNARRAEVEKQIQQLTRELNTQQKQVNKLEKENRNLRSVKNELNSMMENEQHKKAQMHIEMDTTQEKLKGLSSRCANLEILIQERDEELKLVAGQKTELLANKTDLEAVIQERDEELKLVAEQRAELLTTKTDLETLVQESNKNLSTLHKEFSNIKNKLELQKKEYTQLITYKQKLKEQLGLGDKKIEKISDKLNQIVKSKEALELELSKLTEEYKKLDTKNRKLVEQKQQSVLTLEQRDHKIKKLEESLSVQKSKEEDMEYRQKLVKEEMVRAESQLDIIKELLIERAG